MESGEERVAAVKQELEALNDRLLGLQQDMLNAKRAERRTFTPWVQELDEEITAKRSELKKLQAQEEMGREARAVYELMVEANSAASDTDRITEASPAVPSCRTPSPRSPLFLCRHTTLALPRSWWRPM